MLGSGGPELCWEMDDLFTVAAARCHLIRAAYSCQQLCMQCLGETNIQLSALAVYVLQTSTKSLQLGGKKRGWQQSSLWNLFTWFDCLTCFCNVLVCVQGQIEYCETYRCWDHRAGFKIIGLELSAFAIGATFPH